MLANKHRTRGIDRYYTAVVNRLCSAAHSGSFLHVFRLFFFSEWLREVAGNGWDALTYRRHLRRASVRGRRLGSPSCAPI